MAKDGGPRTALVVVDPQVSFCDAHGSMARQGRPIDGLRHAAQTSDALARDLRDHGVTIIWTRMVFAQDYSDGGELIRTIRPNLARIGALRRGSGDELLSDVVTPHEADIVIDKPRFSALVGTELEGLLRAGGYQRVLVCGVTTSMCVESTVRDLGQRDFETHVVADACADFDVARHQASLEAMEFGFARIIDCAGARHLIRTNSDG
ncbi:cysteine hydrolase [Mesorhizobium sp. CAU 1741]|uniref:cysteine hydrolase family protein n=1 Tax=Mesorhizobium sp. CAU 1741 TaxID=3140366 RepID=UPI00325B38A5